MISNVKIMPGQMMTHSLKDTRVMNMNYFFTKYTQFLTTNLDDLCYLGKSFMYGLEKCLDSRSTEANLSLAYETNHNIRVALVTKPKTHSAPILLVTT